MVKKNTGKETRKNAKTEKNLMPLQKPQRCSKYVIFNHIVLRSRAEEALQVAFLKER
jgi:hypothetical protein